MKIEIPNTNKIIGEGEPVFIIAEIGKNFIQTEKDRPVEEYLENAKKLVDAAVEAGADAVKFQTHNVEDEILNIKFISPHFPNWKGGDRYGWISRNTFKTPVKEFWLPLKKYCQEKGILFFSTPMSRRAAQILNEEVGVDLWKIGSGDILDFVMLDYIRRTDKPIILSSGMSTLEELEKAVNFIKEKNKKIILMHCVSKYPCPPEDLQLGTIGALQKKFNLPVGFSDHSLSINSVLASVSLGAVVVEKHFSMSRQLWGPDHKASLEPKELKELTGRAREIEKDETMKQAITQGEFVRRTWGAGDKILQDDEAVFRPLFRKSLVAGRDIKKGEVIQAGMVYAMRPQEVLGGLPSEKYESVIGKKAAKDIYRFDAIDKNMLEAAGFLPISSVLPRLPGKKRKMCFIITSFIHYSRSLLILEELKNRSDVELHIIIGGSAVLPKYASKYLDISHYLEEGGFKNIHEIYFNLEGSKGVTKAKSTGLGVVEFSSMYQKIRPLPGRLISP